MSNSTKQIKSSCKEIVLAGKFLFGISLGSLIVGILALRYSYNMNWLESLYVETWKGIDPISLSWTIIGISAALLIFSKYLCNKDKQDETNDIIEICQKAADEVVKAYTN